jgi:hypothetical protein
MTGIDADVGQPDCKLIARTVGIGLRGNCGQLGTAKLTVADWPTGILRRGQAWEQLPGQRRDIGSE